MELPRRKLPCLQGYDYSQRNFYYITICTHQKSCVFGAAGHLNRFGKIAEEEMRKIPMHFENVAVDKFVVMPNHIHAILVFQKPAALPEKPSPTLSTVVGLYKSGVSKRIHQLDPTLEIWQKSFYDTVIRGQQQYLSIWNYIEGNPLR